MPCNICQKRVPASVSFQNQIIYSFNDNNIVKKTPQFIIYKFPYSKNTFWFNFKYSVFNSIGNLLLDTSSEVYIEPSEVDIEYALNVRYENLPNQWCHLEFPVPSIQTDEKSGIFLKIYSDFSNPQFHIKSFLQGFNHYYPSVENYMLMTPYSHQNDLFYPEILFKNYDALRDENKGGIILYTKDDNVIASNKLPENEFIGVHIYPL